MEQAKLCPFRKAREFDKAEKHNYIQEWFMPCNMEACEFYAETVTETSTQELYQKTTKLSSTIVKMCGNPLGRHIKSNTTTVYEAEDGRYKEREV